MPKLRLYPHGLTIYRPSGHARKPPPSRGRCKGWTISTSRSFVRFLMSVDWDALSSLPVWAYTLTVRDCPPTPDDWKRVRTAWFHRLRRSCAHTELGLVWLTEWQGRGVPHLHGIVIMPEVHPTTGAVAHWLGAAARFRPAVHAQTFTPLYSVGFGDYLCKHSARGVTHYQRAATGIPKAWQGLTGRMWGYIGNVPRHDSVDFDISPALFFRVRRDLRNLQISQARTFPRSRGRSVRLARAMLSHPDPVVSRVRGLSRFMHHGSVVRLLSYYQGEQQC